MRVNAIEWWIYMLIMDENQINLIRQHESKIDYLFKRVAALELQLQLQTSLVRVADRVSDELKYQMDCMSMQRSPRLILSGAKVNDAETAESLKEKIKGAICPTKKFTDAVSGATAVTDDKLANLQKIADEIDEVHRLGRPKGEYQDVVVSFKSNSSKKNLYGQRKDFHNKFKLRPYLTKMRHAVLQDCIEHSEEYNDEKLLSRDNPDEKPDLVDYVFADIDGVIKVKLGAPLRGKKYFTIKSMEDFISLLDQYDNKEYDEFMDEDWNKTWK